MIKLYEYLDKRVENNQDIPFKIKKFRPSLFRAYPGQLLSLRIILCNVYWWLITSGKYRLWCVLDDNKVIHVSYVVPKCYKFPFLDSNSVEIGPCVTEKEYRGRGIYPFVLNNIVSTVKGRKFMIIHDTNKSSIRGVLKAGFKEIPGEIIVDTFKRYCYKR